VSELPAPRRIANFAAVTFTIRHDFQIADVSAGLDPQCIRDETLSADHLIDEHMAQ
jgi:hypothetical protein